MTIAARSTVAIETHGCKLNQADSSVLARQFTEAGYRLVSADEPADVYIVNTCTVTHIADRKARHSLRAARRRNPDATIVVTGCYPQRSPDDLHQLKEVDIVTGNVDKASLVRLVTEWRGEAPVPCAVGAEAEIPSPRIARTRAMVKIQEGCDQVCAYCIVPKVRGRERSIPSEEIISEIQRHVGQGYKEVVLTGTQLGSYGFDLPDMTLTRLLARILSETDVTRLRISSLQPQDISPEMLDLWSDGRLCPHFHLPLQSGSDTVLGRMRRRYSASLYAETVELIRQSVPDVSITADVIVGFPGETESEFEETYALCERIGFADMHVFPYSVRPGTSAAHFDLQVASADKSRRMRTLLDIAKSQAIEFRRGFQGRVRAVLWEEARDANSATSVWSGLTDNYIRVLARSSSDLTNQVTLARLGEQVDGAVFAEILP
ncbi:MAG: tRNA (N(6)-L-threonylcarbamoyladenosine(37)-C(2))-methylthiotransferase MtaB [Chloroflexi bacterium]|nr:tRNA (N(6)-L-threonylcarbamoyladenosine(37)-C(2))-methylthiotransferase MtaB [Chloroflexota bacterium]